MITSANMAMSVARNQKVFLAVAVLATLVLNSTANAAQPEDIRVVVAPDIGTWLLLVLLVGPVFLVVCQAFNNSPKKIVNIDQEKR